jgi:hypothetical protein
MQTSTGRGMMTMEQSLANLVLRRIIDLEIALECSSRPEQLEGLLERGGFERPIEDLQPPPLNQTLRVAGA